MIGLLDAKRLKQIADIMRVVELGIANGDTLIDIGVRADQILGLRDVDGKLLDGVVAKAGMTYDSLRIIRTELGRSYADAQQQIFEEAKDQGLNIRYMYVATMDNRTRRQSAKMDGQISDEQGRFQYPDGNWYYIHNTGHPEWDINDRCDTVPILDDGVGVRKQGAGVVPYQTFEEWAMSSGLDKSKYGELYF